MTQEEKQLLLVDLSARLTHKVRIKCDGYPNGIVATGIVGDQIFHTPYFIGGEIIIDKHTIDAVRPYLRPMSSMTEEERDEIEEMSDGWFYVNEDGEIFPIGQHTRGGEFEDAILPTFEWLNKKMFDYRDLIPMGLALEAPEGMYKTE